MIVCDHGRVCKVIDNEVNRYVIDTCKYTTNETKGKGIVISADKNGKFEADSFDL